MEKREGTQIKSRCPVGGYRMVRRALYRSRNRRWSVDRSECGNTPFILYNGFALGVGGGFLRDVSNGCSGGPELERGPFDERGSS